VEKVEQINFQNGLIDLNTIKMNQLEFDSKYIKIYKKRIKSVQRRNQIQHLQLKRCYSLLKLCLDSNIHNTLKDLIQTEIDLLKYKYY